MTRPLPTGKKAVQLAAPAVRVSRIRRDPPPVVKEKASIDPDERDRWAVVVGVLAFAFAICVLIFAFGSYSDWSPSEYTVELYIAE